ncbi:MAG: type II CRISPR-associated endonuclease Cas1 [Sphaerochaetaceae bacterium]
MSWRVVVISRRAKLELKLNYLVVRNEEIIKIHISEIAILIIENTAVSLTVCLLTELIRNKIKVVFCDEQRNPLAELAPFYGSFDATDKLRTQIAWPRCIKELIWTEIVSEKILKQAEMLKSINHPEFEMLLAYRSQIEMGDSTNREGHAAKVYFNSLFSKDFSREINCPINAALNYGYSIILSAINREIVANGYLTQLGLFHDNTFNYFNFGCDLMEPFRPLVDSYVFKMRDMGEFSSIQKLQLVRLLNEQVKIMDKNQVLLNAIKIYCKSIFNAINEGDTSEILFYSYEF